jgi:hypothetical protein
MSGLMSETISPSIAPPPLVSQPPTSRLSVVLSVLLALFLFSAVLSFLDDSLLALFKRQDLTVIRLLSLLLMLPIGLITYLIVAAAPGVPKRPFLTIALFLPVSCIAVLPLLVYFHAHAAWIGWMISLVQVMTGCLILKRFATGPRITWPLVPAESIAEKQFRWSHFAGVVMAGLFLILPAMLIYTMLTAKLAVDHFSEGFVHLRPSGLAMEVREYVRDDGRRITLMPMSHVGESTFYQDLAESFTDDSVVLMEGVSDRKQVVTAGSNYSKMAESIGVVEQQSAFKPRGEIVAADMDMSEFSPATIDMLKTAMLIHSKGVTAETMPILMKPTPPGLEKLLMDDILTKRNHHLLKVLHERLPNSRHIVVPWGAAHMPEIAREIEKSGFRVTDTREYTAIRFGQRTSPGAIR